MAEHQYDLVVIGSGPAGEKGAARAAYEGKKVAVVESSAELGGAVTSSGVPTKALRETALNISGFLNRGIYGVDLSYKDTLDVQTFLYRERHVQNAAQTAVAENLKKHHIRLYSGLASFDDPHTLRVSSSSGETTISGDIILISTGSRPVRPPAFPFDQPNVYDSSTILKISKLPKSLTVVGGGIVGCEYACLFGALGIQVSLIHSQEHLFPFIDHEISFRLLKSMQEMGLNLWMSDRVEKVEPDGDNHAIKTSLKSGAVIESEAVLVAVGRVSNTDLLRLENAGVQAGERGLLKVNEFLQTEVPHIYAAGDVIGFPALSSTSMEQGRLAVTHAFQLNYRTTPANQIPFGIWTIPEISLLGETEETLQARGMPYLVGRALYENNPRGLVLGEKYGMLKLIFTAGDLKLLGVHIIGQEACELIAPGMMALEMNATARDIIGLCFNFPSLADMYKYASYDALGEYREGVRMAN
ncbi:MAG TPA: Si-specific NAD(P)(+) transhydrogenase [Anaerolineaceae bacterium]|nr:Si-specific NAD(P)(+) transhydrogenase [Anaerolineaceae bacterium]